MFLDRVCCLAQRFCLKVFELLLSLIYDYSLFVDPGSLSNTTKELDMVLSVTCTHTKRTTLCDYLTSLFHPNITGIFHECVRTPGVYTGVNLHLWVRRDHAGPPWIGSHFGPHQISYHKLLTEARLLNYGLMVNLWNLKMDPRTMYSSEN